MAASANPSENSSSSKKVATTVTGDVSRTQSALRHSPGISPDWTSQEQSILQDLLITYASEFTLVRYAKIAHHFKDKTVRDVALRCRWINKKENGKRRKDGHSSTKNKDTKGKGIHSSVNSDSYLTPRPNDPSYALPIIPMDNHDAIGGATGDLLEKNAQMFNQVSVNFGAYPQIHNNISLLSKARDNIYKILNDLNDLPEVMRQMPALPVKVNDELANSILLRSSHQMNS
ncbi:hypothetical protein ACFE04_003551 [Oxalis oulophora]